MTISPEAKEATEPICPICHRPMNMGNSPNSAECTETDDDLGLCRAYAEIERLRGEVEKAWREGFGDGQFGFVPSIVTEVRRDYVWQESRAKQVVEGVI